MVLPEFLSDDFRRFAFTADEWLIAYAHLSASFVVVYPTTFSIAMVLELYLKAYAAFLYGNGTDVTKFGHKIADLYQDLQSTDPDFPIELRLSPQLSNFPLYQLDRENWQCDWYCALPLDEREEIRRNYEIYMAMAYATDLKYGVSPALPRHNGRVIRSSWSSLNPWLAEFARGVRTRIGYPDAPGDGRLFWALERDDVHPAARAYLKAIHEA